MRVKRWGQSRARAGQLRCGPAST